jgi:hypothetical protein
MSTFMSGMDPQHHLSGYLPGEREIVHVSFEPRAVQTTERQTIKEDVGRKLFGGRKIRERVIQSNRPLMLSDVLREINGPDAEAHMAGYFMGRIPGGRGGNIFRGSLVFPKGELTAEDIRTNPTLLRTAFEHLFPELFEDIRKGRMNRREVRGRYAEGNTLNYEAAPHHVRILGEDLSDI